MNTFFEKLWHNYESVTPTAERVRKSLQLDNYEYFNDHVAFRSVGIKGFGIDRLIKPFLKQGYEERGQYIFEEKKLKAIHLENVNNDLLPKVFISEILVEEFSSLLKNTLINSFKTIENQEHEDRILVHGRSWPFDYQLYLKLRQESEYGAWLYAHGYRVNHFTIRVNSLDNLKIRDVCGQLLADKIPLNESGGTIKGSEQIGLEQASTLADNITFECDKTHEKINIPSCYVEFAERFELKGKLFNGFVAKSANHIFESTNQQK